MFNEILDISTSPTITALNKQGMFITSGNAERKRENGFQTKFHREQFAVLILLGRGEIEI